MKKVHILGAGLVVKPMVEYLLKNNFKIMIASRTRQKADDMIKGNPLGNSLSWSVDDSVTLEKLVGEYDIVVSLLPYKYHTSVARVCIRHGKSLITTSYVQPEMFDLNEAAKSAGVILLNEIGLDPGIDHMSAMKIIDHIHDKGGDVKEFYSLCGALPAPEVADNPMKYKFSWSPEGVILASRNSACYLKKGQKVNIEPSNLFKDRFNVYLPDVGNLEVYPNRDSMSYIDIYGIPETSTMYRGTFRYKGWCETLDAMKSLNLLDDIMSDSRGKKLSEFLAEISGTDIHNLKKNIALKLGISETSPAIRSLDFLGFFSDEILQEDMTTPFKITSGRMIKKMSLSHEERDMVILQHIFLATYPDKNQEVIKSTLIDFGSPSTSTSVSRTVALPAAIAVKMILEKKIDLNGVFRPVVPEIYNPVLNELKTLGIEMKEEYGLPESEMI